MVMAQGLIRDCGSYEDHGLVVNHEDFSRDS